MGNEISCSYASPCSAKFKALKETEIVYDAAGFPVRDSDTPRGAAAADKVVTLQQGSKNVRISTETPSDTHSQSELPTTTLNSLRASAAEASSNESERQYAYLVYSTGDHGTLTAFFSKTALSSNEDFTSAGPGAKALCRLVLPAGYLANFKFTTNAGRQSLGSGCGDKKKFLTKYLSFLKEHIKGVKSKSPENTLEVCLLDQYEVHEVQIAVLTSSNSVHTLHNRGVPVRLGVKQVECIAVVPKHCSGFAVNTLHEKAFMDKGLESGAAEKLGL